MKKRKKEEKIDILRLRCSTDEYNYLLFGMGFIESLYNRLTLIKIPNPRERESSCEMNQ